MIRWVLLLTMLVLSTGCAARHVGVYTDDPPRRPVTDGVVIDELKFEGTPLVEALAQLADRAKLTLWVDWETLEAAGVERTSPVTMQIRRASFEDAVFAVATSLNHADTPLGVVADTSIVRLTTEENIRASSGAYFYDLRDIIHALTVDYAKNDGPATQPAEVRDEVLGELIHGMHEAGNPAYKIVEFQPEMTVIGDTLVVKAQSREHYRAARAFLDSRAKQLGVGVRETAVRYETSRP